jgi:hypothetical protein
MIRLYTYTENTVEASQFYLDADDDDFGSTYHPMTTSAISVSGLGEIKKTKVDQIHYSKTAKRVDVKKLKDNIWQHVSEEVN